MAGTTTMELALLVILLAVGAVVATVVATTGESLEWLLAGAGPAVDTSAWLFAVGVGGDVAVVGSALGLLVSAMKEEKRESRLESGSGVGEREESKS